VISRFGNIMDDGFLVPSAGDGMGAFAAGKGKVALVRNHELNIRDGRFGPFTGKVAEDFAAYDRGKDGMPLPGGTTTLIYDLKSQKRGKAVAQPVRHDPQLRGRYHALGQLADL
jgi:secreted PhoX family phosphatase